MTWLDSAIGWISPTAGLRRVRARAAMQTIEGSRRSYEGGKVNRRTEGWVASSADADAALGPAAARLRARSRDLVRNNPWASKAVAALTSNVIGAGIVPRADVTTDTVWARWGDRADAAGRTDIYGLQAQIVRCMVESGEVLIRRRMRFSRDGLDIPMQIEILEPDHLDTSRDTSQVARGGGFVYRGVEFDAIGRRVAYWLYQNHPGNAGRIGPFFRESRRVPADEVLHIYEPLRPGQIRGVPWLAPAIIKLRDLDEYDEAELVRKKIEACFAAFVTGDDETATLGAATTDDQQRRIESFEPGMVEYLPNGRDVKFGEPKATGGYPEYMRVQLHAIASAVGLTYEQLTGDLSQVNFSSARMGWLEFRRRVTGIQTQILLPQLLLPLWGWFVDVGRAAGQLPGTGRVPVKWTLPRFEAIEPFRDAQAELIRLRSGTLTLPEAIAGHGYDPADQLAEIAATNATLDQLKLVLDSDPRLVTKAGGLQASGKSGPAAGGADDADDDGDDDAAAAGRAFAGRPPAHALNGHAR